MLQQWYFDLKNYLNGLQTYERLLIFSIFVIFSCLCMRDIVKLHYDGKKVKLYVLPIILLIINFAIAVFIVVI